MTRSRKAVVLLLAALLAAPLSARAESPDALYLREAVLRENDPAAAHNFLGDGARQGSLRAEDAALYRRVFARAAELKDLQGLLSGVYGARSVRLGLLERPDCAFCLNEAQFTAWVERHMPYLGETAKPALAGAYWNWNVLDAGQREWLGKQGLGDDWARLELPARHERMRRWALVERGELMKVAPKDKQGMDGYYIRIMRVAAVLGNHELTEVWNRFEDADQAVKSLAEATERVGRSADPKLKALLAEAQGAGDPAARLSALSRLFDSLGERPRDLLAAAPPREDQRFDGESRRLVASMLATALLKETEGTWAGADLKEFYARTPLTVAFSTTGFSALGWYYNGTDVLHFNERYVESYLKSRGSSVEDLKRDPAVLRDLARTLVGTFVHEAQHHRQDVWRREAGAPRLYAQGHEVEAFQVQALFLLEKMRRDKGFREFAEREQEFSPVLKAGLGRAARLDEQGPQYFEWTVPHGHYPELLSGEGLAWCSILWHNHVADKFQRELDRRASLPAAEQARLRGGAPLAAMYPTQAAFEAALLTAGTPSLSAIVDEQRALAEKAPEFYARYRRRTEELARQTATRYEMLKSGDAAPKDAVPSPVAPKGGSKR